MQGKLDQINTENIKTLIDTALGKLKADMVIANADLVNVYSGELLKGQSVAIKGEKIAYVGEKAEHTIGPNTRVIDATGKTLIPGFIDAHMHLVSLYAVDEFLKYGMRGGTTTIITEITGLHFPLGDEGIEQFLEAISDQPIKILASICPMLTLSPAGQRGAIDLESFRRLIRHKRVVGLGETYWSFLLNGNERILELFAETLNSGKTLEGHSAGAGGNKLAAYIAAGISSCHEPINAEEVLERLRLGLHTMIREGYSRRDLKTISKIKDEKIDTRRLILCTDGVPPIHLMEHGYMEFVVQKAIDLGFDPIVAIQMATINPAEHFHLDNLIGGIAPGKYADMVLIPDLRTIQAEMVISNGHIIAQQGELLVPPRKHFYPEWARRSVHLPRKLEPEDFHIPVEGGDKPVTVRAINQITEGFTREEQIVITPKNGFLEADIEKDILKVAVVERTSDPGKMFVGLIKGFKLHKGAFASSNTWNLSGIVVVGTNDEDMAGAVNRVFELQGADVVYAGGKVLEELPLPIGGCISDLTIEELYQSYIGINERVKELGATWMDAHFALTALTSVGIPFLRICEAGLMEIRKEKVVGLIV